MRTIIDLYNSYHHPDAIRIIIAAILFIPFIYLLTYRSEKPERIKREPKNNREYKKLYEDISGKLSKEKELA